MAATKMTRKGQVTIPAEIRQKLHLKEGDLFVVNDVDGKVVLQSQRGIADHLAGVFAKYAKNAPSLTDDEMDEIVAQAIVDDYLNSERDR
jgi:AbrB family looped-hinge helix DNA binding protein